MKKLTVACGLLLALTACSDEPPAPVQEVHSLAPKIVLDVQTINLADRSGVQLANSAYNGNHFTPTIAEAIKQWSMDRMQASGQTGRAVIIIKDASLTAQPLQMETGFNSWFKRQQGLKYIGHAEVSVEANGAEGYAITDATATRSVTLPENPTPSEKQDAYYSLITGLMKDLEQNLDSGIHEHMDKFVITAPVYGSTAVPTVAAAPAVETQPAPVMSAPVLPPPSSATGAPVAVSDTVPAPVVMAAPAQAPQQASPSPSGKVVIPLSGRAGQ